jgi:phosphoribosylamine--glycine ligase
MNVLVVGGGAREHALAWAVRRGGRDRAVLCVPGNAGIASVAECLPGDPTAVEALADLARSRRVDLTIVGPEASLAAGLADELERRGMKVFGASRAAAEIETSKIFSKEFMHRHGIPTAPFDVADSPAAAARILAKRGERPSVVKADGLAAGKGVVVAATRREAEEAVAAMLVEHRFGPAGDRILIEDRLSGPEVSCFALCDGERARPLTTCQDYKRLEDGDRGPNTGGMGGYSPSILVDAALERSIMERIVLPTVRGLAAEGRPYRGVLYTGLMLTPQGPQVLEYNARFGDPEAELIAVRLASDFVEVVEATLAGRLDEAPLRWHPGAAVCVVLAAAGYPGTPRTGDAIEGLEEASRRPADGDELVVFHAATRSRDGRIETAGGRVLTVTARADSLAEARRRAYSAVAGIRFPGMQHRRDIALFAASGTGPATRP